MELSVKQSQELAVLVLSSVNRQHQACIEVSAYLFVSPDSRVCAHDQPCFEARAHVVRSIGYAYGDLRVKYSVEGRDVDLDS